MTRGHYLNPHIDNSHDKFRADYRVLDLLYYTSPDWQVEFGGSLELWPNGPRGVVENKRYPRKVQPPSQRATGATDLAGLLR
jgi:Rps23 Pro-64 3,4-dihydroxylase Tpa1-like proline 4-hydroxylase